MNNIEKEENAAIIEAAIDHSNRLKSDKMCFVASLYIIYLSNGSTSAVTFIDGDFISEEPFKNWKSLEK